MLKSSLNIVLQSRFVQLVSENKGLKEFCFRNGMVPCRKYFNQKNFHSSEGNSFRPPPRHFSYKKPIILFGGFLAYLGFPEKPPEEPELIMRIKRGILFMQRKQYDKAEIMLHMALELAQEQNDQDGITYVYDIMANLYFETGQHSKAEKLFVNVLQNLLAKGEPQDSNKVVHISLKLSKIFQDMKDFKKAEQGYLFCIETLDKKLEEVDEDTLALWGMSMDWYARFLLETNRKNEALTCFKKAYDMCVKVNGVEHEQSVVLLNDLGTVASLIGDSETAMNYLEKARDIGNKLPEMEDLPAIYINLGQLYLLKEMFKESKIACQEGLRKAKTHKNEAAISEAQECLKSIEKVLKESKTGKEFKLVDSHGSGFKTAKLVN